MRLLIDFYYISSSHLPQATSTFATGIMKSEGRCEEYITTKEECEQAAREIDRVAACEKWGGPDSCVWKHTSIQRNYRQGNHPPGCYLVWVWSERLLSWNDAEEARANPPECSKGTECICKDTSTKTATTTTTTATPTTTTAGLYEYNTKRQNELFLRFG